ncbi:MAG: MFS transporter [Sporolactobacillus sp.]
MTRFKQLFLKSNYRRLFLASFASQLGTVISTTSFTFYFLDHDASRPYYASLTQMMYTLPSLTVFLFSGSVADTFNRQKIALYSDRINSALCILLLLSTIWQHTVLIFFFLFLITASSKFFQPAQIGLIQGILSHEEYAVAGGFNQMLSSLFLMFGTALGAFIYWMLGITGSITLNGISFLVSASLISHCKFKNQTVLPHGDRHPSPLNWNVLLTQFRQGFLYSARHPVLRYLMLGAFILGIVNGGLAIMPVYLLKYQLAPSTYQQTASVAGIIFGLGILIGSFVASWLSERMKLYQLMIAGFFLASLAITLIACTTQMSFFFLFYFITAFSIPIVGVPFFGWLPQIVAPKFMGRVQALLDPIENQAQLLFFILLSCTFPNAISVTTPFIWFGGCLLAVGLLYLVVLPKAQTPSEQE